MNMATAEREEAGMAEVSDARFEEFAARIEERLDRSDEKADERFVRFEEVADDRFGRLAEQITRVDDKADVRLDKLVDRITQADENAKAEFVRAGQRSDEVDRRLTHVDHESNRMHDRLDDLVKVLIGAFGGYAGAVMACFGALIVLIATKL
jgi:hypothetical protein